MSRLILLNKPFNVLSQFTDTNGRTTLSDFVNSQEYPDFYPAGRLDYDSEGLLLLTDDGRLQHRVAHPENKMAKTYWVQVEGEVTNNALKPLTEGLVLKDGRCLPAIAKIISEPELWSRHPPIRERKNKATSWLSITITEGKNRLVRRMTAAIGFPTLRLVRTAIGPWSLDDISPGQMRCLTINLPAPPANTAPTKRRRSTRK